MNRDRIRGSLIGGAIGDALGYAIEFNSENQIFSRYGSSGITEYRLTNGKALVSDDTQMTLFTAAGILSCDAISSLREANNTVSRHVHHAYQDWLKTQKYDYINVENKKCGSSFGEECGSLGKAFGSSGEACGKLGEACGSYDAECGSFEYESGRSWLLDVPELYSQRAPGITCLSALEIREIKSIPGSYIDNPINTSKGCGGIMRIAPLALRYRIGDNYTGDIKSLDKEAAEIAAITHSHSLGYMTAAVMSHIISRIISSKDEMSLKEMVLEARDTVAEIFAGDKHLPELVDIINLAVLLSEEDGDDLKNIHALGEGWVAEETLGIALYCALKYKDDFSKAIIVSVNHKGDSDSTGAVTGNILGALVGYEAIEEKWKKNLELSDVILEVADEIYFGCRKSE